MLFAIRNNQRVKPRKGERATCPCCGSVVIAKCGEQKIWHWAHYKSEECDSWAEMGEWHLNWQEQFPSDQREIVMNRDGILHRADVVSTGGVVIEFQHSPISWEEIEEREQFYQNMIWVFDVTKAYNRGDLEVFNAKSGCYIQWIRPKSFLFGGCCPMILDTGDFLVLLKRKAFPGYSEQIKQDFKRFKRMYGKAIITKDFINIASVMSLEDAKLQFKLKNYRELEWEQAKYALWEERKRKQWEEQKERERKEREEQKERERKEREEREKEQELKFKKFNEYLREESEKREKIWAEEQEKLKKIREEQEKNQTKKWEERKQVIAEFYGKLQSEAKQNGWADTWVNYQASKAFGTDFDRFLRENRPKN
jgi:flagellar biosynthesis GTPase FlhF